MQRAAKCLRAAAGVEFGSFEAGRAHAETDCKGRVVLMSAMLSRYLKDFGEAKPAEPAIDLNSFADDTYGGLPDTSEKEPAVDVEAERREAYSEGHAAATAELTEKYELEAQTVALDPSARDGGAGGKACRRDGGGDRAPARCNRRGGRQSRECRDREGDCAGPDGSACCPSGLKSCDVCCVRRFWKARPVR